MCESNFDFENFSIEPDDDKMERDLDQDLKNYGLLVNDFEISPYESLNMLDLRDILEDNLEEMSTRQQNQLMKCDFKLLQRSKIMSRHLYKVYDFKHSEEIPLVRWWWHLNDRQLMMRLHKLFEHYTSMEQVKLRIKQDENITVGFY